MNTTDVTTQGPAGWNDYRCTGPVFDGLVSGLGTRRGTHGGLGTPESGVG